MARPGAGIAALEMFRPQNNKMIVKSAMSYLLNIVMMADGAGIGFDHSRILLCSTAGVVVFQPRGLAPTLISTAPEALVAAMFQ